MSSYVVQYLLHAFVLSIVAGVPMLLLGGCCIPRLQAASFRLLPWSPLPALLTVLFIPPGVEVHVAWFFMGSTMGIDATGRIFLGLTAAVWLFSSLSVRETFGHDPRRFSFAGYYYASMAGNFGLILARDTLGFYLFFALMSFSAYGLIAHSREEEALKAGRVYLMLVFLSEIAMFAALVVLGGQGAAPGIGFTPGGNFSMVLLLLLFIAFGVKVGALPLQSWMVLSYQQAPAAAATALAGAMVNAGILGWMRFVPFGREALPAGGTFFILMGAAAALYGVIFGFYQQKIGRVLAFSSISQMGLVTVIAGYGMQTPEAGRASLVLMTLFAVHHSLAKTSLFLGYELLDRGKRMRSIIFLTGILLPCLSLSGLPLTSGAMVKGSLKELAASGGAPWYMFGKIFLPLSSGGTTMLMLHCTRLFWRKNGAASPPAHGKETVVQRWVLSVAAVILVPWLWAPLRDIGLHSIQLHALLQALWPVLLGAAAALAWFKSGSPLPGRQMSVLDFEFLTAKLYAELMRILVSINTVIDNMAHNLKPARLRQRFELFSVVVSGAGKGEKELGRWSVVGLCYLLVCIIIFLIMFLNSLLPGGS